ncbi:MAG TPA: hypothetical protein VEK05_09210 [Burkholderiales bacterium]|nr:hypothetical protein [Burkholderiales bacterium]
MLTPSIGTCLMPSTNSGAGIPVASRIVGTNASLIQINEVLGWRSSPALISIKQTERCEGKIGGWLAATGF